MALARLVLAGICAAALACSSTGSLEQATEPRWAPTEAPGPALARPSVQPRDFDPARERLALSVEVGDAASALEIAILDERGVAVRSWPLGSVAAGRHGVEWDGALASGDPAPSGVYRYEFRARGVNGGVTVLGDDGAQGGEEVLAQRFTYEARTGEMTYILPRPSRVRLRVGIAGLPYLDTLYDWSPQAAGRHSLVWDGADRSGAIQLLGDPRIRVVLQAYELPRNTIILAGAGRSEIDQRGSAPPSDEGYRHARHDPAQCRDFPIELAMPSADRRDEQGRPVAGDEAVVRVALDPSIAPHLVGVGFEVMVFLDTVLLFEEEEGTTPFSFPLDLSRVQSGSHAVTVNVLTTDDHAGIATLTFSKE